MRNQFAFLVAAATSFLAPCAIAADDQQHGHGAKMTEVYPAKAVPPGKAVRIVQLDFAPHDIVPLHCHSGDEIGIVTQGILMLQVGNSAYETKRQGDSFNVKPGTFMTVKNDTDQAAQLYSVLVVDDDGAWLKHDPKDCTQK